MKRIITLTFIMCCLLLTGCDNASIGVIGGADGPTKIIVSEKENSTIKSSDVKKYFKEQVYNCTIPRNIRLAEAPSFGLPIILYDEKCRGAEAYKNLTKEFLERQN